MKLSSMEGSMGPDGHNYSFSAGAQGLKMSPDMIKTNKMSVCPAQTQISLGNHPVWSVSPLGA